jgi:TRAP transporter 4TM/12TM fusion protein
MDTNPPPLRRWLDQAARLLAGLASLLHLYWAATGVWSNQRVIHVAIYVALAILIYPQFGSTGGPAGRRIGTALDILLLGVVAVAYGYVIVDFDGLQIRSGEITMIDVIVGIAVVATLLETTRRSIGKPVMILACIFLVYDHFGQWFPGLLGHRGFSVTDIADLMVATTDGVFGIPVSVMASYVVLFMIFGALLDAYGAGQCFLNLALVIAGRFTGGPAKVAVISSMLLGTISGSSVANVVTTGTFTIPLMKRLGFVPSVAGAVEAVASTGGMLMPPVMGAAAFILADIVGVPYAMVALAAAVPAILYYLTLFAVVHFYACRHDLRGLPAAEIPPLGPALKRSTILVLPIVVLVHQLIFGYTPGRAVFWAIVALITVGSLHPSTRRTPLQIWEALIQGSMQTVSIALTCATAGIIIGAVSQSGLALKFGGLLIDLTGGSEILVLVVTMLVCLVFGMGLPATASYLTTAVLAVPALTELGAPKLAAHLFVFYFSNLSAITPPVALAAFAAAGIARTSAFSTGYQAVRFSIPSYLLPFLFMFQPALLLIGVPFGEAAYVSIGTGIAFLAIAYTLVGYRGGSIAAQWDRLLALAAAVLLLTFQPALMALGLVAVAYVAYRIRMLQPVTQGT